MVDTLETVEAQIFAAMAANNWAQVAALEPLLDRLDIKPEPPSLLTAAQWYITCGIPVFPLQPGLKTPFPGSHGCKDATTNPTKILQWWNACPTANIGIATGHTIDVIDIDGPQGIDTWHNIQNLPKTVGTVKTPRPGGYHLYITATGHGNRAAIMPGIDYRGQGGYVVAPPSKLAPHPAVNYHGIYQWRDPLAI